MRVVATLRSAMALAGLAAGFAVAPVRAQPGPPAGPMPAGAAEAPASAATDAQAADAAVAEEVRDVEPNQQSTVDGLAIGRVRPGFWEGTSISVKPRTYYLNRDRDTGTDIMGWALGGSIEYKSGWLADTFQLAGTVYTSQILDSRNDGTLLFKPGPEGFTVLGEAYVTARLGDGNGIRVGRQSFDLPWLARHDIRMVPNTFEAAVVGRQAKSGISYVAGYVDKIKRKNDDQFIPMSEAAGALGSHKGVALAAAQYTFADGSLVGATNQTSIDVMNTFFVKGEKSFPVGTDTSFRLYGQYTDQRSVGDELIGSFKTYLAAIKGEFFWKNASIRVAASRAGSQKGLQSPYGGPANYLSIIVDNFDRAGEKAVMVGASYDFKGVGIDGLSMFANVAKGRTPNTGPTASPDETEYDLTLDYKFGKQSVAKGLWVRVRGAWINQDEKVKGDDFFDFRVIVNYSFDLL